MRLRLKSSHIIPAHHHHDAQENGTESFPGTSGIGWEPAPFHAFLLLEEFVDGPEAGKGGHAADAGPEGAVEEQREGTEKHSGQGEGPPAALAEVIFRLDDDGMEKADYEEGRKTYYQS